MNKYALTLGLICGVLYYCFVDYGSLKLFGLHIYLILFVSTLCSALISESIFKLRVVRIYIGIVLGVFIAVSLRIAYDIYFWDETSHNLMPFEIIISMIISLGGITSGLLIGRFIKFAIRIIQ